MTGTLSSPRLVNCFQCTAAFTAHTAHSFYCPSCQAFRQRAKNNRSTRPLLAQCKYEEIAAYFADWDSRKAERQKPELPLAQEKQQESSLHCKRCGRALLVSCGSKLCRKCNPAEWAKVTQLRARVQTVKRITPNAPKWQTEAVVAIRENLGCSMKDYLGTELSAINTSYGRDATIATVSCECGTKIQSHEYQCHRCRGRNQPTPRLTDF